MAEDCDGATPRRERAPLASRPDLATLKRWLRRWVAVRHREAAERTVLTAIAGGASPAALADLLFAAETDRAYADGGHSLDFINKAFECLDLIGWEYAADVLPSVVGQMAAARGAEESTAWRQPVDLIALCQTTLLWSCPASSPSAVRARRWSDHAMLAESLLADDPAAIIDALKAAAQAGRLSRRPRPRARLCGGAQGGTLRHRQRARRLGDRPSRLHLCQRRPSGARADRRRSGPLRRCRSRPCAASCTGQWRSISPAT